MRSYFVIIKSALLSNKVLRLWPSGKYFTCYCKTKNRQSGLGTQTQTHLKPIKSPASKFEKAGLLIEGKKFDVNFTGRFEDCRGVPNDFAVVVQNCFCHRGHNVVAIGTENKTRTFSNHRYLKEVDCSLGQFNSAKLKDKQFTIVFSQPC